MPSIRVSFQHILRQPLRTQPLTLWSGTSKACRGLLCCKWTLMIHFWLRMVGLALTNTSAASRWSWREVRARWHCWGWHWRGLAIDGKWEYSEDNHMGEGCDNDGYVGWTKSSSLSPPLCPLGWLLCLFGCVQLRHCRRRAGSVAAVGWRWSGGSSPADLHWHGWHGSQKDRHCAAERHQTPVRTVTELHDKPLSCFKSPHQHFVSHTPTAPTDELKSPISKVLSCLNIPLNIYIFLSFFFEEIVLRMEEVFVFPFLGTYHLEV